MDGKTSSTVHPMTSASGDETAGEQTARRSRVSGIDRALQVIDYLYETGAPAGVYAIAKAVKAPLSTVYVIVEDPSKRRCCRATRMAPCGSDQGFTITVLLMRGRSIS